MTAPYQTGPYLTPFNPVQDGVDAAFQSQQAEWMERKQTMVVTDQHGRGWSAMFRMKNKPFPAPVSPYAPIGWHAPFPELVPPQEFLRPMRGNKVFVDYDAWRKVLADAQNQRLDTMRLAAKELFGSKAGDAMRQRDPEVLAEVGRLPLDVTFVDAMASGQSAWVLGLSDPANVPSWVTPDMLSTIKSYGKAIRKVQDLARSFVDDVVPMVRPTGETFTPSRDASDPLATDAQRIADRMARAEKYAEDEEVADPAATGGSRKRVGRTRQARPDVAESLAGG